MGKTRSELRALGTLLFGFIVPGWFKPLCDGCSVPTCVLRWLLGAGEARAACVIHDFMYYLAALRHAPGSCEWECERAVADLVLKHNIRGMAKGRIAAAVFSRLYYAGVHWFGGGAMWKRGRTLPMPPTLGALRMLRAEFLKDMTPRASEIYEAWEMILDRRRIVMNVDDFSPRRDTKGH